MLSDGRVLFRVWAPYWNGVEVKILNGKSKGTFPLKKEEWGYFSAILENVLEGDNYLYVLNQEKERPDPASRSQLESVHGPSVVVNPRRFVWKDQNWKGIPYQDLIFYEMHVGTFTKEGTFHAAIAKIPYLKKLGITCVELMPVAQFPGRKNWGYDGVGLYCVQNSYGGFEGLQEFVNACHLQGIAVCLDVVYNHLGPEGNYLGDYGPYFTKKYQTPWGSAVNYDGEYSYGVRNFIIQNACSWICDFHIDVLRLDAVHCIYDFGSRHILEELNSNVQKAGEDQNRLVHIVAESDLNDSKVVGSVRKGGWGLAGQWSDDFHHSVHAVLSGEKNGYYEDFGKIGDIAKALQNGFIYDGCYSAHRKRIYGNSSKNIPPHQLVICTQNHDQVGNRAYGERLSSLISFEKQKIAAFLLILSPNTPLLFMGQEYGETNPFKYFIDAGDSHLREAVREGRAREFAAFGWKEVPDPCSEETFEHSKLNWNLVKKKKHACLFKLYRDLMLFRKKHVLKRKIIKTWFDEEKKFLIAEYSKNKNNILTLFISFNECEMVLKNVPFRDDFKFLLHSESSQYGGKNSFKKTKEGFFLPPVSAGIGIS